MLPEPNDYPAAHSMDTTWFAVDRDGYVAEFFSGENGAVPLGVASDSTGITLERVTASLPQTTVLYDPAPGRQPAVHPSNVHHGFWSETRRQIEDVLTILSSSQVVADELARGEAVPVPVVEGFGVVWRVLPRAVYDRLHEGGHCLYCTYLYLPGPGDALEAEPQSSHYGLFSYVDPSGGSLVQAYARHSQPQEPVTLDQLPDDVRDEVGKLRFSQLSFRETPFIHPVELAPECLTHWTVCGYMNTSGTVAHALPGLEAEFLEQLAELREAYPGLTFELPDPPAQE